jgi:DNA-directed RNA polymerase III subunit RPC1
LQQISQLFPVFDVNTGVVKNVKARLIVVHDCSKVLDGHTEELKNIL